MLDRILIFMALGFAAASFIYQSPSRIWVVEDGARVVVRALTPDGRPFNVMVFDSSLLKPGDEITGIDMSDSRPRTAPPDKPVPYIPLRAAWAQR